MEKELKEKNKNDEIDIERCLYCKSNLYGKKETIGNITYYGLYCKKCNRWLIKDTFVLDNRFMYMDKETYSVFLIPQDKDDIMKIKKVLEEIDIDSYKVEQFLKKKEEISIFKGNAQEILNFISLSLFNDNTIIVRIEPEFPYSLIRGEVTIEELDKLITGYI